MPKFMAACPGKKAPATVTEKRCPKCGETKPASEFSKAKGKKDGLQSHCKLCKAEKNRRWYKANKEKVTEYQRQYCQANKKRIAERKRQYREANKKKIAERGRRYHKANKEKIAERKRRWCKANKEKLARTKSKYKSKRLQADPAFRLAYHLRARLCNAIRQNTKAGSFVRDLGMAIPEFKAYIETMWLPGMTWENWGRGGWHLDHIFPLAKADLTDRAQFLAVANWQNYQPLWEDANLSKGDTVTPAARRLFNRLCRQFAEEAAA